ncbi:MIF4G domain containing protein [Trichomonas vaginalis G3]|uniref:MIF4G domain containing protein n=1 Tax=Trichomonas vaginalis (strain ATCC PRA-98 / G3) TaxID=412133 RepID=A2DLB6_TRIV3|nr:armadillo (ARM) repeat-containing protein family [Trichomonas vaginalis G3]EAY18734.1 MIF4G domain containing protein [Trichomonas vaginalis G3]KAI5510158.1 armadillo (ARM) repeat-containing protein family [Trichomonas vaginalis G3]|eukprot:XP_001579720.1 MIF4G domain containing protein [Trichomonas vaginalis G3]
MNQGTIHNVPMISIAEEPVTDDNIPTYTLEMVKSFNHSLKITSPDFLKKLEQMKYYRIHQNDPVEANTPSKFKAPADQMIYNINHYINKLTADIETIKKMADKMIHELYFGTEKFITSFLNIIVDTATIQSPFAMIYTRFLQEIYIGLPTTDQKTFFRNKLAEFLYNEENLSSSRAFFIGCLTSADLTDKSRVFEIVKQLTNDGGQDSYEILFNLLIYSGQKLENTFPDFDQIISSITEAACNTSIPQRVRFMLMDLLEEREANWKIGKLLPNFVHVDDSKESEQELSGVDASILRSYITERSLPSKFTEHQLYSLLFSLAIASMKNYEIGIGALKELANRKEKVFKDKTIILLQKVKLNADKEDVLIDYPYAVRTIGAIFGQLIILGFKPELFGSDLFPYDIIVFIGLLEELVGIDRIDIITNSPYLYNLKFLPDLHSHSQVISELVDFDLTDIYPVYDAMKTIFQMINDDEPPELVMKYLFNDLDKSIFKSTYLVEFVTEFMVIHKPQKYGCLMTYIAKRPLESFAHIESIGEMYQWKPEQIAANIRRLARLINAPLDEFKKLKLRPFHDIVVKFI